jgi:hypothetical protein
MGCTNRREGCGNDKDIKAKYGEEVKSVNPESGPYVPTCQRRGTARTSQIS